MEEKLLFQYIMNYKAYRRIMIATRVIITALLMGGMLALVVLSIPMGIVLAAIVGFLGAIWIITALNKEMTYMVFDNRIVIKNRDKRISVPLEAVKSVKYRRAFYEKDLATGTVVVTASVGGKTKSYKLRHIFDAAPLIAFLTETVNKKEAQ